MLQFQIILETFSTKERAHETADKTPIQRSVNHKQDTHTT